MTNFNTKICKYIYKNDLESLKLIFQSEKSMIDINAIDDDGYSFLDSAIVSEFEEGALFLIEQGINTLNHTENDGWTIHLAIEYGMESIIKKIIEQHGGCINLLHEQGQTPIRITSVKIRIQPEIYLPIFEMLIKNGADPYIKNKFGKSAIDAIDTFCDTEKNEIYKLNEKYKFIH